MKRILVTGGAGFIGSNFINYILSNRNDIFILNLDKLTYAGNLQNLKNVEQHPNYTFIKGDIVNDELVSYLFQKYEITHVINFAAESHVDRSILGSEIFFRTNVLGTNVLLENAKRFGVEKFIQISTDEVYGSLGSEGQFEETTPLQPNSPYSASKAAADMRALVFDQGEVGEVYNVGASIEKPNIDIIKSVLKQLGKTEELIEYVKDRPGHDRRYAINSTKIKKELGGEAEHTFEQAMKDTIHWYLKNEKWWKEIISGEYQNYYKLQYSSRSL